MNTADIFKWVATGVTLSGGLATALMYDPFNIYLLNIGALLFLIWGYLIRDKAMIVVNSGMLLVYIIGILVRL